MLAQARVAVGSLVLRTRLRRGGAGRSSTALPFALPVRSGQAAPGPSRPVKLGAFPLLAGFCSLPDFVTLPDGHKLFRPIEPEPDECCGNNCEDCVWTVYADDLKAYRAALAKARGEEPPADPFQALEQRVREAEEVERMEKMEREAREKAEKVKEKVESEERNGA